MCDGLNVDKGSVIIALLPDKRGKSDPDEAAVARDPRDSGVPFGGAVVSHSNGWGSEGGRSIPLARPQCSTLRRLAHCFQHHEPAACAGLRPNRRKGVLTSLTGNVLPLCQAARDTGGE